jgi:sarcosine oxidase, subunit beta
MPSVAVAGAGIAGLVLALELRRLGESVTVVERRYPGAGNSTRNVGRIRRMQLTPDLTAFSCRASDTWAKLDRLMGGRNPLLYPTTYAWVLYDGAELDHVAPLQRIWDEHGARARVVGAAEAAKALPVLRGGERVAGAVLGDAAIVHHDAAVHNCYLACMEAGVEFRFGHAAVGVDVQGGTAAGLVLDDGSVVPAGAVVNAAGGQSGALAEACGARAPNRPKRREVLVTEPSQPFMSHAVTFYRPVEGWFNQTLRGELVAGVVDAGEQPGFTEDSSLRFLGRTARVVLQKAPRLGELKVIRQWAGVYDITPDKRPLVGQYPEVPGLYALNGWSGRGIAFGPLSALLLAREIAGRGRDPLLEPFDPKRFEGADLTSHSETDYYAGYSH